MEYGRKKDIVLALIAIIPITVFFTTVFFKMLDLWTGLILGFGLIIPLMFFGKWGLEHPMLAIIEKRGLGCLNIDSTGMLKFYITSVRMPYIDVKAGNKWFTSMFDRRLVVPVQEPQALLAKDDGTTITLTMPKEDLGKNQFGAGRFNFFLWNDKIKSFITKESLGEKENEIFVDHTILNTKDRVENLHTEIGKFVRYFMDKALRREGMLSNNLILAIIIAIALVVIIIIGWPIISGFLSGTANIIPAAPVTPVK